MSGWYHNNTSWKSKSCLVCNEEFKPKSGYHKFCSEECKGKWKYITEQVTTNTQYKEISNSWSRYLSRLLYSAGRKRDGLTREILLEILEKQNYKCALSGIELTCKLEVGKRFWTNASVDKIIPNGSYKKDNIQLVCRGLNSWRSSISIEEFIWWCEQVVNYNFKKERKVQDGYET